MKISVRRNTGVSLTETVVSVAIMTLIFGAMAYLTYASGRNFLVVREQSLSQQQAASAAERLTNVLRNARSFKPYTGDAMNTTVTRVMYDTPDPSAAGGIQTGIIAFQQPSDANASNGIVKMFADADDYSGDANLPKSKADFEFDGIERFDVVFNSPSWITVAIGYSYTGFTLSTVDADNDGIADQRLVGEFQTDIIAKNHSPGESAQYANTTTTLFQL